MEQADAKNLEAVEIPAPEGVFAEPWSLRKLFAMLRVFGPAAVVASVTIGAGETIVVVRAGAWAGYGLLWVVLLSTITKAVFVTYLLGRYTAVTGELPGHRLVRMPGPRGWFLLLLLALEMLAAPMAWVVIAKPCGDLLHFVLAPLLPAGEREALWQNIFTTALMAAVLFAALRLPYARLERRQIAICGILVAGTIAGTLMVRPDFGRALEGMLAFGRVPDFPSWAPEDAVRHPLLTVATIFGYVGTSVLGYVVYADWVAIRRWGLNAHPEIETIRRRAFDLAAGRHLPPDPAAARRLRRLLTPLKWDVGMGAAVVFLVTAAFMVAGAAVLYPLERRFEGWDLLTHQAYVWRQIHPALVWVYYVSILAGLLGTLLALPEIYARVSEEFLSAIRPERHWSYDRLQRGISVYILVSSLALIWSGVDFDILNQAAGFLFANLAVALVTVAALALNLKLPRAYRPGPVLLAGSALACLVLLVFAAVGGWSLAAKLFG